MTSSLVGSEMCIRDSSSNAEWPRSRTHQCSNRQVVLRSSALVWVRSNSCLLYTSDAADDM
eukprot:855104-Prorocentrum_lima.AAC.1